MGVGGGVCVMGDWLRSMIYGSVRSSPRFLPQSELKMMYRASREMLARGVVQ